MFVSIADMEAKLAGNQNPADGSEGASSSEIKVDGGQKVETGTPSIVAPVVPPPAAVSIETPPPSAYVPNYKFKFGDQEIEVDERIRPIIKDKESEEYLRGLYERYHGYEPIKAERDQLTQHYGQIESSLKNLMEWRRADPARFFQATGITEDEIINYAQRIVQFRGLPKEQQEAMMAQVRQNSQMSQLQSVNQNLQSSVQAQQMQMYDMLTQQTLGQADVQNAAREYDAKTGRAGSFQQVFLMHGHFLQQNSKTMVLPDQVLGSMRSAYPNLFASQQAAQPVVAPPLGRPHGASASPQVPVQNQPAPKPIPTMGGSNTPPATVKRRFNSIADIEKYNAEQGEDND